MTDTDTTSRPAEAIRLRLTTSDRTLARMSAQPAQWQGSRTVILRIYGDKRLVYEIPLDEWNRLNRDALGGNA